MPMKNTTTLKYSILTVLSFGSVFLNQAHACMSSRHAFHSSNIENFLSQIAHGLIGPEIILGLLGIFLVGYSLFTLVPSSLVFFGGKIFGASGGFGWTYLGSLTGGILFSTAIYFFNKFTGDPVHGIINFDFAILGWGLVGMFAGAVMGMGYSRKPTQEASYSDEEE